MANEPQQPQPDQDPHSPNWTHNWQKLKAISKQLAQTPIERHIVAVTFSSDPIEKATRNSVTYNKILDLITTWRKYLVTKAIEDVQADQMHQEANFLIKYFPACTIEDIEWAIDLYITRRLPMTYPSYPIFNCDFMASVLAAYATFKNSQSYRLRQAVAHEQERRSQQATPEQRAEAMRFFIQKVAEELQRETLRIPMIKEVFDYLVTFDHIQKIDQPSIAALEYATQRIAKYLSAVRKAERPASLYALMTDVYTEQEQKNFEELFLQEYQVAEFLKTQNIDEFCKKILPEQFKRSS